MKKTKNFRQQLKNRYDSLVTKAESILEHYTCPETCDAKCCKHSPIKFNNREYHEIIRKVDKDSAAILKSRSVFAPIQSGFYKQFPTCVCPLLKESKLAYTRIGLKHVKSFLLKLYKTLKWVPIYSLEYVHCP